MACSSNVAKVKVTVNHCCDGEISGQLSNAYDKKIYKFSSMWNMIKVMDSIFDEYVFPQASHEMRSFVGEDILGDGISANFDPPGNKSDNGEEEIENICEKANFIIHVHYRQNATWQGKILWVEGKQAQKFRSALEMQRLMNSAVSKVFHEECAK